VWNITEIDEDKKIEFAIEKTENFFRSLPLRTRLSECGVGEEICEKIVERLRKRNSRFGENGSITPDTVKAILEGCR
jgi:NADP-dependent alcohol dehydrogenase